MFTVASNAAKAIALYVILGVACFLINILLWNLFERIDQWKGQLVAVLFTVSFSLAFFLLARLTLQSTGYLWADIATFAPLLALLPFVGTHSVFSRVIHTPFTVPISIAFNCSLWICRIIIVIICLSMFLGMRVNS